MKTYSYTAFGTTYPVRLEINNYAAGGTALHLIGAEGEYEGETITTASVKLHAEPTVPPGFSQSQMIWVKDYSENEGLKDWLVANDIIKLTGEKIVSGFVWLEAAIINAIILGEHL